MNDLLLYALTVLLWGSTWLVIEFQLGVVAPEVSVCYRYLIAAALLFAWCRLRRLRLSFNPAAHVHFALLGLMLFSLNYIAAYVAQLYITSALNAIAFSCLVWMNIVNARLFFGIRASGRVVLGAALGIAGVIVLFWPQLRGASLGSATLLGALISLSGAAIASLGNMVSQRAQAMGLPVLQGNAWGMFYGALATGLIALLRGRSFDFDASPAYVVSLLYLAIFGSVVAFGAYLTLLGRIGAHKAGYVVVMFPIVAVILSVLFEDLAVTANLVGGAVLVLSGNVAVLSDRHRQLPALRAGSPGQRDSG